MFSASLFRYNSTLKHFRTCSFWCYSSVVILRCRVVSLLNASFLCDQGQVCCSATLLQPLLLRRPVPAVHPYPIIAEISEKNYSGEDTHLGDFCETLLWPWMFWFRLPSQQTFYSRDHIVCSKCISYSSSCTFALKGTTNYTKKY